jgi:hypothetical protein
LEEVIQSDLDTAGRGRVNQNPFISFFIVATVAAPRKVVNGAIVAM